MVKENHAKYMNKNLVSVGLAAVGVAMGPSAFAQGMSAGATPKMWNISSNLRGFYDDNYAVAHNKTGSFGFEVSPSVSANVALQQTDIGVRYTFGMYYYLQRADNGINPLDYTHEGDIWLDHSFNERFKLNVTDSFTVAQDPLLLQGGTTVRANGNNLANRAQVTINSAWTREFSTATHYGNNLYLFNNDTSSGTGTSSAANPSNRALLNRIEQSFGNDFQWTFTPQTMGFIGYAYSWVLYTGNEPIANYNPPAVGTYYSNARNSHSHYLYVGVTEQFSQNLSGTAKVGAYLTDVYNNPVDNSTSLAPYADINVTYTYIPGSYFQVGFTQDQNATDVANPNGSGQLTDYQNSSVLYATINHQITPKITGSLIGQYQYSQFQNGQYGGTGDQSVNAGANLSYQINRHFSANAGYNFDTLISSITGRGNNRNVVYLGLGANY